MVHAYMNTTLRLLFLSETGSPLIMHEFNSSYANSIDWFSAANLLQTSLPLHDQFDIRYNSPQEVTFGVHSQPEGVFGLYAGALQYNSSQYFLFSANGLLLYLPGRELICKQMGTNGSISPLPLMRNFTHNRGNLCASFCRQNNFSYSFLYNMTCGCDNTVPNTAQLPCNIPCPGNFAEQCGGFLSGFVSAKILENIVNVAAVNSNTFDAEKTWMFQGTGEFDLGSPFYFWYGSITLPVNVTVGSILRLELSHKLVTCNDYAEEFYITTINITVTGSTTNISLGETIGMVCAKLKLEDATGIVGYSVTLTALYKTGQTLLTAPTLAVQAAWEMCDCDCWVYNLLYGDSPYKNMTYAEKEQALQDTITKIQKELTVNTSELSATIRKKTSAEDSRVSAIVVGYTLGVALLSFSLGSIIIFDLPRLLEGFKALLHNLTGR
ncbi:hypothetical protein CHS0354_040807 [Potamilus streckersoni]|uniref:WSC domain-containing protein n=1 Tax=Potamilus streckersoni TaxID=2493646 RepID=A0AAE0VXS0_9BIVA|nr:hypothetical protein CHS0354_040807 [Potamilus streckersoni]